MEYHRKDSESEVMKKPNYNRKKKIQREIGKKQREIAMKKK